MADDNSNTQGGDQPDTSAATENTDTGNQDSGQGNTTQTVPYNRFAEVNQRYREVEAELEKLRKAEADRQEKEKLAQGKHEEIIAELRPQAERAQVLEATLTDYLNAEIADIPEDKRGLIPDGDVASRLAWIKKAKSAGLFSGRAAPDTDAGAQGEKNVSLSQEELKLIKQMGISQEQYIAEKRKREG